MRIQVGSLMCQGWSGNESLFLGAVEGGKGGGRDSTEQGFKELGGDWTL